jgi:osmotically-inducible protein OsmY
MIKQALGVFLAGAAAAFLLDPVSGKGRRSTLNDWMQPMARRLRSAGKQVAASDTLNTVQNSVAPTVTANVKDAVQTARSTVVDMTSKVSAKAGAMVGRSNNGDGAQATMADAAASTTTPDYRAEVAPGPGVDPIPEGATNDPTLVSRVESELFKDGTVPKGEINIDATNGVVTLRGTIDGDKMAGDIVERTRAIEGVAEVVDMLKRG